MVRLLKHNEETYAKVCEELKVFNHVGIVQATGTGKSFLTMALFQEYFAGKKKLYVVPRNSIADSIQMYDDWDNTGVVFVTYQLLSTSTTEQLEIYTKLFDVILLDEFHHAGAETWIKAIRVLLDKAKYVIGLTATPIRYLDNARDMGKEIFGSHIVQGPDIETAIKNGILPKFQYIALLYDLHEFIEEYKSSINKTDIASRDKLEKLRLSAQAKNELGVTIRKYITPTDRKWIVFAPSIEEVRRLELEVKDWFDEPVDVYKAVSGLSKKEIKRNLEEFKNSKNISVILTVDMLNEGVHIDGVTDVVMLRKTNSIIVFLQQLGRALSAGSKSYPKVFDVAGNYSSLSKVGDYCRKLLETPSIQDDNYRAVYGKEIVIVDDLVLEALSLIKSIKEYKEEVIWETYMDNILREQYPIVGPSVYRLIPGTNKTECSKRAKELGIRYKRNWTKEEDDIIKKYYPQEGSDVFKRLQHRTADACASRASTLKVRFKGKWTVDCDIILLEQYPLIGEKCFNQLSDFTREECMKHVISLNLLV